MKQIYHDLGMYACKLVFIRYNPDSYRPSYGSEFKTYERLSYLLKTLGECKSSILQKGINVRYLFYDDFTQTKLDYEFIDPYESTDGKSYEKIKIKIRKII